MRKLVEDLADGSSLKTPLPALIHLHCGDVSRCHRINGTPFVNGQLRPNAMRPTLDATPVKWAPRARKNRNTSQMHQSSGESPISTFKGQERVKMGGTTATNIPKLSSPASNHRKNMILLHH